MDIMELGAIGELVGGVAVIASLIYVGLQVRQSARDTRASNFHAVTDSFNALNIQIAGNAELAEILDKGNSDRQSLNSNERVRYDFLYLSVFRILETVFTQSRSGAGETDLWRAEERTVEALLSARGVRQWWKENPLSLTPQFRQFVESQILPKVEE